MVIRAFESNELEQVIRCFTESVRVIGARYYEPEQIDAWAPAEPDAGSWSQRLSSGDVFVADVDGHIAGFVSVEANGLIDLLYVHPAYERRGIGAELLRTACDWAAAQGATRLEANVSLAAKPLFAAAGFTVAQEQSVEHKGVMFRNFNMTREPSDAPAA